MLSTRSSFDDFDSKGAGIPLFESRSNSCSSCNADGTDWVLQTQPFVVLPPEAFEDTYGPDYDWAAENVPFFECSDPELNTAYSFRWRVYR